MSHPYESDPSPAVSLPPSRIDIATVDFPVYKSALIVEAQPAGRISKRATPEIWASLPWWRRVYLWLRGRR